MNECSENKSEHTCCRYDPGTVQSAMGKQFGLMDDAMIVYQTSRSKRDKQVRNQEKIYESQLNQESQTNTVNWSAKYIELQKELATETIKWGQRYNELESAYKQQLDLLTSEFEKTMEKGYEEAYQMLVEQRRRSNSRISELEIELKKNKTQPCD